MNSRLDSYVFGAYLTFLSDIETNCKNILKDLLLIDNLHGRIDCLISETKRSHYEHLSLIVDINERVKTLACETRLIYYNSLMRSFVRNDCCRY